MVIVSVIVAVVALALVVVLTGFRTVPTGKVGVVYKRFGGLKNEIYPLRVHGGQGVQAATLRADHRYFLPPLLYRVQYVERTVVPTGTIGVVIAKVGAVIPVDRTLCEHVECDYFQDGPRFLREGGQMGKQPMVLPGGASYDINPALFEVITAETLGEKYGLVRSDLMDVSVPEGATGVVIAKEGAAPDANDNVVGPVVAGHSSFQRPWVFLDNGGRRGAQAETLPPGGVYRINPWFARVVIIPTRELMLEWAGRKRAECFDTALDEIVVDVEGYRLRFTMAQIIRIPAEAAPRLVRRFGQDSDGTGLGPVQRFVERVLGGTVESYFSSCAAEREVLEFVSGLNEVRMEVQERVAEALEEWGVQAGRCSLSIIELDEELDARRRDKAGVRDKQQTLLYELKNAELEQRIQYLRIETERAWVDSGMANGALPLVAGSQMNSQTLADFLRDLPPELASGEDEPAE
ncbi:SPFH domain-containing protein [Lentzea sp. NPDC005914]|uniref:SPFH domain-containing protein n=1 Tax=Lentzea sp. NPDC005914 TaxID=3154572 RepID=UPI0033E2754B